MTHFMLDIETLSTEKNALVWSVGMVEFDPNSDRIGESWEWIMLRAEQNRANRHVDPITVQWTIIHGDGDGYQSWLVQNMQSTSVPHHLCGLSAIHELHRALTDIFIQHAAVTVWVNGASFDFAILHSLFRDAGFRTPWHFRSEACIRSIRALLPNTGIDLAPQTFSAHKAVADARHQSQWLQKMISAIRDPKTVLI